MRVVIPAGGKGERLHPITLGKAKAMIEVAGKPILGHIIDNLLYCGLNNILLVTGYHPHDILKWATNQYGQHISLCSVVQEQPLGLGDAILSSGEFIDGSPVAIVLGDNITNPILTDLIRDLYSDSSLAGVIGLTEVGDPRNYGMVSVDSSGVITSIEEKPDEFSGTLGIAGLYVFRNGRTILKELNTAQAERGNEGISHLSFALQSMIDSGLRLRGLILDTFHDCGRIETLLQANKELILKDPLLSKNCILRNSEIIPPNVICEGARIINSKIGPYVSIGKESMVEGSQLSNFIVESDSSALGMNVSFGIKSGANLLLMHDETDRCGTDFNGASTDECR
ncbi:MAG: hypothetical protein EAX95_07455 [Candidatus Thorarchaeota archaeon]|nr:hypothetical protein [Candidatus Thorarchaeota archaeon]